ncbi:hypothetical protein ES707_07532 [subsurface metagenome]
MEIACGCEVKGGMPVSPEMAKEHFKHTFEAMLFWELTRHPGDNALDSLPLAEARIVYIEALEARFPELKEAP